MKNENGLNQLSENIKAHRPFKLFHKGEYFAKFEYDEKLKRYQSDFGYLSNERVLIIAKGEDEIKRMLEWC